MTGTYITISEITTLGHKPCNNPVEGTSSIAESLLIRAKCTEILRSSRNNVIKKIEVDTAPLFDTYTDFRKSSN